MSRFLVAIFVGAATTAAVFGLRRRHITAWPAAQTEQLAKPSASYLKGLSQFHYVGAYITAVGLVEKSHGVDRTKVPSL